MSEKYTPGPWAARHAPMRGISEDTWCIDWSADQEEVAEIVHGEANAHLIAAAPELLWVVRLAISPFCKPYYECPNWVKPARAAIFKATGEPL